MVMNRLHLFKNMSGPLQPFFNNRPNVINTDLIPGVPPMSHAHPIPVSSSYIEMMESTRQIREEANRLSNGRYYPYAIRN